jgi:hypothetical protein
MLKRDYMLHDVPFPAVWKDTKASLHESLSLLGQHHLAHGLFEAGMLPAAITDFICTQYGIVCHTVVLDADECMQPTQTRAAAATCTTP